MTEETLFEFYASKNQAKPANSYWQKRREVADLLHQLQLSLHSYDVDEAGLDALKTALQQDISQIQSSPALCGRQDWLDKTDHGSEALLHIEMTPLLGTCNPISPNISIWFEKVTAVDGNSEGKEKDEVRAELVFDALYEGNTGTVHGGFIAAVFDEVLGTAQAISGKTGVTGTLKTLFHAPTPINKTLQIKARLIEYKGRKITVAGEMYHGETKTASAEAVFIVLNK
jgi:acyl-coenzyme A thioesterase PaaI-like protein